MHCQILLFIYQCSKTIYMYILDTIYEIRLIRSLNILCSAASQEIYLVLWNFFIFYLENRNKKRIGIPNKYLYKKKNSARSHFRGSVFLYNPNIFASFIGCKNMFEISLRYNKGMRLFSLFPSLSFLLTSKGVVFRSLHWFAHKNDL